MGNRIIRADVQIHRFDPVETELRVAVGCEHVTTATTVTGQLTGPRCPYSSTVEIAYSWREVQRTHNEIQLRTIIPEPSPWDTESPFLYQGTLQLWEDGLQTDAATLRQGIRTVHFGPGGWRWNGREPALHFQRCDGLTEADARRFRQAGCNALLLRVDAHSQRAWEIADRFGLLLLGRIESPAAIAMAMPVSGCTCTLGWVATPELLAHALALVRTGQPMGIELHHANDPIPMGSGFVVVPDGSFAANLPRVIVPPR